MRSPLQAISVLGLQRARKLRKANSAVFQTIRGYYSTNVLIALSLVGFMDALETGQPVDAVSFARREELDQSLLQYLCDYIYEQGLLDKKNGGFVLSSQGAQIHEMLKGAALTAYAYSDVFNNLEGLLRQEKTYGVDINRKSRYVAVGSGLAARQFAIPVMTKVLLDRHHTRILDLACGDATFLVNMCENSPQFTGYGVDIAPEAIEAGKENLATHGLQDRVKMVVADMFAMDSTFGDVGAIDATTCVYALHEFLDDDNQRLVTLLKKYRARFPDVPLVVCEVIRHSPEELRARPGGVMEVQLFHSLSQQKLGTLAEWHAIFRQAGFTSVEDNYMDFARTAFFVAV